MREARAETGALAGAAKDAREPAKLALRTDTADTALTEVVVRAAILIDVKCCTVCADTRFVGRPRTLLRRDWKNSFLCSKINALIGREQNARYSI